jgi:hypothetical protein
LLQLDFCSLCQQILPGHPGLLINGATIAIYLSSYADNAIHMKTFTTLFLVLAALLVLNTACRKEPPPTSDCNTDGVIKSSKELDVTCDGLYIVTSQGDVLQPVMSDSILFGVQAGDRIRFGYHAVRVGMRACGAMTVKVTCLQRKRNTF